MVRLYLARLSFYRRKVWTCEVTGQTHLTYEDALKSERRARDEVLNLFPDVWKKELLQFIHQSKLT
jgi:hypothetical protein